MRAASRPLSSLHRPAGRWSPPQRPRTAAGSFGSLAWLYDKNGNRQTETRNAGTMPYVYSPPGSNWLTQRGSDTRGKTLTGNTASISGVASFTYDGFNRLATSVTAAETTTYTYNALGQRMKKRNQNGLQTVFHYGTNGELLYERDQAGNTKEYVWLNQRPLARIDNGTAIYYYHVDHLGTPQAMTNQTGTVVWKADYEPFCKAVIKVETVVNNLRCPGQYFDRETGLHQNYFRDYDPATGRYSEFDPTGLAGGLNGYAYANANPLIYIDPFGLAPNGGRSFGSGSATDRRFDRRHEPPPPPGTKELKPKENEKGDLDNFPAAIKANLCPFFPELCFPNDGYFVCAKARCTPKCGAPYIIDYYSGSHYLVDPETPCQCLQTIRNPDFRGNVNPPGL